MNNQAYYMSLERDSNVSVDDVPFRVNCAGYSIYSSPFTTNGNRNDYYLQLVNVGELQDGDDNSSLCAYRFIVRAPKTNYHYSLLSGKEIGYYWLHFTGYYIPQLLAECSIETGKIYTVQESSMPILADLFQNLFNEFIFNKVAVCEMTNAIMCSIIVNLARSVRSQMPESLHLKLKDSIEYIYCHFTENITAKQLADLSHLSGSRFRELFRTALGCPPLEYVTALRMNHAKELLGTTDLSIKEIAEMCGYTDVMYFSRIFHKKIGCPPTDYRRSMMK